MKWQAALLLAIAPVLYAEDANDFLTDHLQTMNTNLPPSLNAEVLADLYTANGVIKNMTEEVPHIGYDDILENYQNYEQRMVEWELVEVSRITGALNAVWEGYAQGKLGNGMEVKVPLVTIYEFNEAGLVIEQRSYPGKPGVVIK